MISWKTEKIVNVLLNLSAAAVIIHEVVIVYCYLHFLGAFQARNFFEGLESIYLFSHPLISIALAIGVLMRNSKALLIAPFYTAVFCLYLLVFYLSPNYFGDENVIRAAIFFCFCLFGFLNLRICRQQETLGRN